MALVLAWLTILLAFALPLEPFSDELCFTDVDLANHGYLGNLVFRRLFIREHVGLAIR